VKQYLVKAKARVGRRDLPAEGETKLSITEEHTFAICVVVGKFLLCAHATQGLTSQAPVAPTLLTY